LGERVATILDETIRNQLVVAFDRFFILDFLRQLN